MFAHYPILKEHTCMKLSQALRYPFQGEGWFRRILILTLIQLIPIVGQLILLGYGFDIVRAVYTDRAELPTLRWPSALKNGLRFLLAGLAYLLPILITVGTIVVTMLGTRSSSNSGNVGVVITLLVTIGLPLLIFFIGAVVGKRRASPTVQQAEPKKLGGSFRFLLNGLLPVFAMILLTFALRALVSLSGLNTGKPNGLGILLFAIFALLIFLFWIVLHIGGVRQAIENKGLLAPIANLQLLLKHRALTGQLLLKLILLGGITVITTTLGLLLFILPGLFAFVLCSLALWYLFAQYSMRAWIHKPDVTFAKSTVAHL